eukprot:gb/GECH01006618.1/.p1 GENE.gb/GECH01006618.1/~~gb/GECH01006618.1/.p1  ORF type:complete len:585 (+),score=113.97 gb/GECH01006618.1/:1-1755(+)
MGCSHSSYSNSHADEYGRDNNNVRSYLHALPKLFAQCNVGGVNFLCTCNVTSPTFNIVFACTDACEGLYQKQVTLDELEEIREALDVNHTIGWWAFFSALKHSFFNKRVFLKFETHGEEEQCLMSIELNFVTLGRTSLSLRLRKAQNEGTTSIATMFIYPLYDFYALRSEVIPPDRIAHLEKQVKLHSEKVNQCREYDKELMIWLKERFGDASNQAPTSNSMKKRKPKKRETSASFVTASEYLKSNSQISRTKTTEAIVQMFDHVDEWNFDLFTLDSLTEGGSLFVTGYTLFVKYGLLDKFSIDEETLIAFLREIQGGYHPNPYHNSMHAADVTQVLHYIIFKGGLIDYMTDEDVLAALIAAMVHDYDHPGLNNAFQVNSQSYLATLYNDRAILENHHCAMAFELMRSKQFNILAGLTNEQRKDVRETIIQMILATDMAQHAQILGKFRSRIEEVDFSAKEDVRIALQIAIKCADVSNPARPQELYRKWAVRVCDEFYKQGDKERELGLPMSPFMDRTKPALAKGQTAFINYIVQPMFESFASFLPEMSFTDPHIEATKDFWNENENMQLSELQDLISETDKES